MHPALPSQPWFTGFCQKKMPEGVAIRTETYYNLGLRGNNWRREFATTPQIQPQKTTGKNGNDTY